MSRWSCPSVALQLHSLRRKAQGAVWAALVLAVCLHSLLVQLAPIRKQEGAVRPLTTQFVKREPRLTKALELKKKPEPKRRRMKRKMVSVKPQASPPGASISARPRELLPILARPQVNVSRMGYAAGMAMEPEVAAHEIVGTREDEHVVDMCLEMLDVEALDYGRYPALVIQDPSDKRNIRGFVRLAAFFLSTDFEASPTALGTGADATRFVEIDVGWRTSLHAALVRHLREATGLRASFDGQYTFSCPELLEYPWVCLRVNDYLPCFRGTDLENAGRYMLTGGFVVTPSCRQARSEAPCERFLKLALATQGYRWRRHWTFERLGDDHGIYHCFYSFPAGPPWLHPCDTREPHCTGINIRGHLACVLYSQWFDWCWEPGGSHPALKRRGTQFTINTIIFALTQEGSIAHRVMDSFRRY